MASIRLTQFAGLMPELSAKLKRKDNAQIAHNCLLYDGRLRAMPAYFKYDHVLATPASLMRASSGGIGNVAPEFSLQDAVCFENAPFPLATLGVTAQGSPYSSNYVGCKFGPPGITGGLTTAGIDPPIFSSAPALVITAYSFLTPRPECVSYAVTYCRIIGNTIQESVPVFLGILGDNITQAGSVGNLWHEGDVVQITLNLVAPVNGQNFIRIYRTITAIESGEQLVNTFDTDWYLVNQVFYTGGSTFTYVDTALTQNLSGDLLLSKTFYPPYFLNPPLNFGQTESGWLWFTSVDEIQFSERYVPHAWPQSNYLQISKVDEISDATAFYDTVFLGTSGRPYRTTVASSDDDTAQITTYPYPEHQPCIASTMVTAPFGALYTSVNGVVALQDTKMEVITRDLLNGGDTLYKACVEGVEQKFKFQDITTAAWFNGWYIGYAPTGKTFLYQAPEDLNDVHAFQQLVTMDGPVEAVPGAWALGNLGLQINYGEDLYYLPVPGWARVGDTLTPLCYQWKSKKFVMPGLTQFAAAKVIWDCDGEVCFTLFGDGRQLYSRQIKSREPFRLPASSKRIEFEIELIGTGTVSEVHVASSMQELTEVENE